VLWRKVRAGCSARVQSVATAGVEREANGCVPVGVVLGHHRHLAPAEGAEPSGSLARLVGLDASVATGPISAIGELIARTLCTSTKTPADPGGCLDGARPTAAAWRRSPIASSRPPFTTRRCSRSGRTAVSPPAGDAGGAVAVRERLSLHAYRTRHPLRPGAHPARAGAPTVRPEFVPDSLGSTPARRRSARRPTRPIRPPGSFALRHRSGELRGDECRLYELSGSARWPRNGRRRIRRRPSARSQTSDGRDAVFACRTLINSAASCAAYEEAATRFRNRWDDDERRLPEPPRRHLNARTDGGRTAPHRLRDTPRPAWSRRWRTRHRRPPPTPQRSLIVDRGVLDQQGRRWCRLLAFAVTGAGGALRPLVDYDLTASMRPPGQDRRR